MDEQASGRVVKILLVEDSPDDVLLVRRALKGTPLLEHLQVVGDGVSALACLRREGEYAHVPRPDLVLLDLGLPRKDGRQVLTEIRQDADLGRLRVAVMTSSREHEDLVKSYNLRVDAYLPKPVELDQLLAVVKRIKLPS